MNVLVEAALIATPVPLLAIARDVWIRARVESKEKMDRIDRIEKERLDRDQAADIAVIAAVPAFIGMDQITQLREAEREITKLKSTIEQLECELSHESFPWREKPDETKGA